MVLEYTFSFFRDGPEAMFSQALSFDNDAEAIREAGELLRTQQELKRPATSITVARGIGDEPEWLGAWQWDDGARWHPEE